MVIIGMQGEPAAAAACTTLQEPGAHRVFSREVVPGSRDPGSGGLHRLPGWEVWAVDSEVRADSHGSHPSLKLV